MTLLLPRKSRKKSELTALKEIPSWRVIHDEELQELPVTAVCCCSLLNFPYENCPTSLLLNFLIGVRLREVKGLLPAVGLIVTSTCLCASALFSCVILSQGPRTFTVSTRFHDGIAVDTFHCDTALLLWQGNCTLKCFAWKYPTGLSVAFASAEP